MYEVITANDNRHNYSKSFKKYLRTRSRRSLEAIFRTKRLDVGFFWLEFFPLVKDIFLTRHEFLTLNDFDVIIQLHANQPFTVDDVYAATLTHDHRKDDWDNKTSLGLRRNRKFMKKLFAHELVRVFKKHGAHNKTLYEFTPYLNKELKRLYEQMLCLSKIRHEDPRYLNNKIKKSKAHYKKILKQNAYYDKFKQELEREFKTEDRHFAVKLREVRAESREL